MSKYELQNFFQKIEKLLMTSFFWSRSWSRTLPVSKPKLWSRPVLVSEKFRGLGRVGLDYSPDRVFARNQIISKIQKQQCEINIQ